MSKNNTTSSILTITLLIAVTITMISATTFSNHIVLAQNQKHLMPNFLVSKKFHQSKLLHRVWHGLNQCKIRYGLNLM